MHGCEMLASLHQSFVTMCVRYMRGWHPASDVPALLQDAGQLLLAAGQAGAPTPRRYCTSTLHHSFT